MLLGIYINQISSEWFLCDLYTIFFFVNVIQKKLLRVELLSGTEENVRRKRWFACSQNRAHALFQTLLTGLDKQAKGVKITNLITLVNQLTCLANHVNDDNSL